MRHIPHKAKPKYAYKFFRIAPTAPEQIMPTRDFHNRFSTEQILQAGITKKELFVLPAGIHVIHAHVNKPKLVKKEIQAVYGRVITSTKSAVNRDTLRKIKKSKKK